MKRNYWRQINEALENFSEPNATESSELSFLVKIDGF